MQADFLVHISSLLESLNFIVHKKMAQAQRNIMVSDEGSLILPLLSWFMALLIFTSNKNKVKPAVSGQNTIICIE